MDKKEETFDVIVIGAGISGIFAAKFYLEIHPECRLIVLERDSCVGGTWNSRRGYDSFWTQWAVGGAEFSDLPMVRPPEEDLYYDFFKAKHTTKYLESYVDHQKHGDMTLRSRIRLGTEVQSVNKRGESWIVMTKDKVTGAENSLSTTKLMVASGLTSIPNMPSLPGKEDFGGPMLHQDIFGSSKILTLPDINKITVLGGGKSSADMVYESVKAGKNVTWLLKETNTTGPGFFFSPKGKGPYKNAVEIGMTRIAGSFAPTFLTIGSWWPRFLHTTKWGVKLMAGFWNAVNDEALKEANYEGRKNKGGFEKLKPQSPIFWQNATGGLLNHADFFDTIAEHVTIEVGDIEGLEKGILKLKSGTKIPTDAILCGTGWQSSLLFFTEEQRRELGLPHPISAESAAEQDHWSQLQVTADEKVVATFPALANPPEHFEHPTTSTPFRLYNNIAPISSSSSDRSIVFIGQVCVGNYFPAVECQSIWATAYMDGLLNLPSKEEQEKEVALFTAWNKRRYLEKGAEGNNVTFELIGYCDSLLAQLGLKSHRKGWFGDIFSPLRAADFRGLKQEYVRKYGESESK